jgi:hypothetical protein
LYQILANYYQPFIGTVKAIRIFVHYFDPENISEDVLRKEKIPRLVDIDIDYYSESKALDCFENVKKYISKNEGEIQFGWIITSLGNIFLKLSAHAVVKRKDNSLLCITLDERRIGKVKFSPDNSISSSINNNFLPARFIPLISDDNLKTFQELEIKANNIRINSSCIFVDAVTETYDIDEKKLEILPALLELAKAHTKSNELCFCGSALKRESCHG